LRAHLAGGDGEGAELPRERARCRRDRRGPETNGDVMRAVDAPEDPPCPGEVQRRAHDDRLADIALEQQGKRARGVLRRRRRALLDEQLDRRAAPQRAHLLRLRGAAVRRPAAEDDGARRSAKREALRLAHEEAAGPADAVRAVTAVEAVAGDDEGW